jgi:hypothetical protein
VFDMSDRSSFEHLGKWLQEAQQCGMPNIPIVVCGNKVRWHAAALPGIASTHVACATSPLCVLVCCCCTLRVAPVCCCHDGSFTWIRVVCFLTSSHPSMSTSVQADAKKAVGPAECKVWALEKKIEYVVVGAAPSQANRQALSSRLLHNRVLPPSSLHPPRTTLRLSHTCAHESDAHTELSHTCAHESDAHTETTRTCSFFETSASTGDGVQEAFQALFSKALAAIAAAAGSAGRG